MYCHYHRKTNEARRAAAGAMHDLAPMHACGGRQVYILPSVPSVAERARPFDAHAFWQMAFVFRRAAVAEEHRLDVGPNPEHFFVQPKQTFALAAGLRTQQAPGVYGNTQLAWHGASPNGLPALRVPMPPVRLGLLQLQRLTLAVLSVLPVSNHQQAIPSSRPTF